MIVEVVSFIVVCDQCGTDGGSSRPTRAEAEEYGTGWLQPDSRHICDDCASEPFGTSRGI